MADSPFKTCAVCKQALPLDNFNRARNRPDGLYNYCRPCDSRKRAEAKNSDPAKAEERRKAKKQYDAVYNKKHAERKNRQVMARYYANPEKVKSGIRKWQAENAELVRCYKQSNKHKRRQIESVGITGRELLAWKREQTKSCYWCGAKCAKNYHVDHYTPLSRGGTHEIANLVIACAPCNLKKNSKDPLDFAREVGRLM